MSEQTMMIDRSEATRLRPRVNGRFVKQTHCGRGHPLTPENTYKGRSCKTCQRERRRVKPHDPVKHRDYGLRSRYGIGQAEYELLLLEQGGACAICRMPPRRGRLHVDHDHETGAVRGLLCARCNSAVDWAIEFIDEARSYLERAEAGP